VGERGKGDFLESARPDCIPPSPLIHIPARRTLLLYSRLRTPHRPCYSTRLNILLLDLGRTGSNEESVKLEVMQLSRAGLPVGEDAAMLLVMADIGDVAMGEDVHSVGLQLLLYFFRRLPILLAQQPAGTSGKIRTPCLFWAIHEWKTRLVLHTPARGEGEGGVKECHLADQTDRSAMHQ